MWKVSWFNEKVHDFWVVPLYYCVQLISKALREIIIETNAHSDCTCIGVARCVCVSNEVHTTQIGTQCNINSFTST